MWHGHQKAQLQDFLLAQTEKTDIFCLQEANRPDAEEVIANVFDSRYFQAVSIEKTIESTNSYYYLTTIIKKPGRVTSTYGLLADDDTATGKALATEIRIGTKTVIVINVHGVPQPGHKLDTEGRLQQSRGIIAELGEKHAPTVLCGDFNLLPHTESIRMVTDKGFRNLIEEYAISTTRNRLAWEQFPDNKQLFADYTFVSSGVRVLDFTVPDIEVSDHLPMIVDID